MSRIPNPYKRVVKRYRWEYLKLETQVSDSICHIQHLESLEKKLDSDIEDVLSIDAGSGVLHSAEQRNNMLAIASELASQKQHYRQQIQDNEFRLQQLKRRLLAAKNRSQHAQDKYDAAHVAGQSTYLAREMHELNDAFAARNWSKSQHQHSDEAMKGAIYA